MFNLQEYKKDMKLGPDHIHLIAHYWDVKNKTFNNKKDAQKSIRRFVKPAKELIELSDNLQKAKENLTIVGEWAMDRGLSWTIETVLKKYIEIDRIKEKDKQTLNDIRAGNYAK